jgi:hypothetical protein
MLRNAALYAHAGRHLMHRRPIFLSALGLPILFGIAVAIALMLSQSLVRAANSPITIGGPFTLTAPVAVAFAITLGVLLTDLWPSVRKRPNAPKGNDHA